MCCQSHKVKQHPYAPEEAENQIYVLILLNLTIINENNAESVNYFEVVRVTSLGLHTFPHVVING